MDIEVIGEQLADGRALARLVDGCGIAGAKEQFIRKVAGLCVGAFSWGGTRFGFVQDVFDPGL